MTELFDPSRKLLLNLCSPVKTPQQILSLKQEMKKLDPDKIARLAATEFLAPLLYYHLKPLNIPGFEDTVLRLRDSYLKNTARNILLLKQIKLLKKQAEREGIPMLLLKGAALAVSVYRETGLRPMADIDILVHQHHAERLEAMMQQNNMHPLFSDTNQNWLFAIKSHIMPYLSEDATLSLETHIRLFDDRFIRVADINPFEDAVSVTWDNTAFLTPAPYTALFYIMYHMSIHHNFSFRLRDMIDLRSLVSFYGLRPEIFLDLLTTWVRQPEGRELLLPLIRSAFDLPDTAGSNGLYPAYLYWTNSVVMKYLPPQLMSRLSDATLRIAVMVMAGTGLKAVKVALHSTQYEVALFYKSPGRGGILKKTGIIVWLAAVGILTAIVLPLFCCMTKLQKRTKKP